MTVSTRTWSLPFGSTVALLLLAASPSMALAAAVTIVDTCGTVVGGLAVLDADLDCTGFVGDAVTLEAGASFDLAGFTLSGGTGNGVVCKRGCKIFSSVATKGVIRNATDRGVRTAIGTDFDHTIEIRNMIITQNGSTGVQAGFCCFAGNALVLDSEIIDNGGGGLYAVKKLGMKRSVVAGNWFGIDGSIVSVIDSTINSNDTEGVSAGGLGFRAKNTTADNNGTHGFVVGRDDGGVKFKDCQAMGNGTDGIHFDRLEGIRVGVSGGSFSGNGRDGVHFDDARFMIDVNARISRANIDGNGANGVFVGPDEPLDGIKLRRVTVEGNGEAGVTGSFFVRGLSVRASTVTDNGTFGLRNLARTANPAGPCPLSVGSSTITGNMTDAGCEVSMTCADVAACELPHLSSNVVCNTSYDTGSGFPGTRWGVCSAD